MHQLQLLGAIVSLLLPAPGLAHAGEEPSDWPAFLGPNATGAVDPAPGQGLEWPEGGPRIEWRTAVGPGYGGAAVRGQVAYLLDREGAEEDIVRAFDLSSGEELWRSAYPAEGRVNFAGPRCVPAVTRDAVVTTGPLGHVRCVERGDGALRWELHLIEELGGSLPVFGFAASPLLIREEYVVLPVLGEEVGLVAVELSTGEEVWRTGAVGYSHSSPVLVEVLGAPRILMVTAPDPATGSDAAAPSTLVAVEPRSGEVSFRLDLTLTRLPVPTPVRVDEERVFLTGGYRSGSVLLRLVEGEDGVRLEEEFRIERGAQVHTPLLFDGHLYLVANENWNSSRGRRKEGGLLCLSLDGEERWRTGDAPYLGRGSLVRVGDRLLSQDGLDGTLRLLEASAEGYRLLGEANLLEIRDRRDHNLWAPLAVAGDRVLMRTQDELICVRF